MRGPSSRTMKGEVGHGSKAEAQRGLMEIGRNCECTGRVSGWNGAAALLSMDCSINALIDDGSL